MQEAASLNGGVCRQSPTATRAVAVALAVFVGALSLLLAPSVALASGVAPMCNELGQSIEAPPTIWPHRGGAIQATPSCPLTKFRQADRSSDRAERVAPITQREAPVAALATTSLPPPAVRLTIPPAPKLVLRPGHVADIYRPPRA